MTLTPGVYFFASSAQLAGMLHLDGAVNAAQPFTLSLRFCFPLPNAGSNPGAIPGFQPLNVREFPDARITSSPTVRAGSLWTTIAAIYAS